jgi:hypothetical protein
MGITVRTTNTPSPLCSTEMRVDEALSRERAVDGIIGCCMVAIPI